MEEAYIDDRLGVSMKHMFNGMIQDLLEDIEDIVIGCLKWRGEYILTTVQIPHSYNMLAMPISICSFLLFSNARKLYPPMQYVYKRV